MVSGGLMSLHTALFVLYGQNIGTCVTALLAATGAGKAAKRAAVAHLLFNVIGAGIFIALTLCLPLDVWLAQAAPDNLKLQIALSHVAFNVTTTLALLPLAGVLEKIARLVVRGEDPRAEAMRLQYFDERLLATPPIAVAQLFRETCRMGQVALDTLRAACDAFLTGDLTKAQMVRDGEEITDYLNEEITRYLIEVKALDLNERDNRLSGALFHVTNDLERIGDHSLNVLENAERRVERRVKLSGRAEAEMEDMVMRVERMLAESLRMFGEHSTADSDLLQIQNEEDAVDEMTDRLREQHIDRLKDKKCTPKSGILFVDMLTNLERVADHATNIAEAFVAQ